MVDDVGYCPCMMCVMLVMCNVWFWFWLWLWDVMWDGTNETKDDEGPSRLGRDVSLRGQGSWESIRSPIASR